MDRLSRRQWKIARLLSGSSLVQVAIPFVSLVGLSTAAHAGTLPSDATVASGTASIATGQNSVTINQTSARAVINWTAFSVGQGNAVTFNQPDASSATLNRVTGTAQSTIAGQITSNGAVYLVNPNGIAITSTGSVQTGGGFVASTLDIADADFIAGKLNFAGNGTSSTVTNAGRIAAGSGAYVALLGGTVSNAGTITVPLGKVGLGSGEAIALDLNGNGFMQVAVPTSGSGSGALVDVTGSISASGGSIQISAAIAANAVRNIINVSGNLNADSAIGNGGTISLIGGADTAHMAGTVTVSGNLSTQATGAIGNGGTIETSGAAINFDGVRVNTSAAHGSTGTWLIDPVTLTIDAASAATISSNLATSGVTLSTSATSASGTGVQSAGAGDIIVSSPITWSSGNLLFLSAYHNIAINANITASGNNASIILQADNAAQDNGTVTFGGGTISLLGSGTSASLYYYTPTYGAPTTTFASHFSGITPAVFINVDTITDLQNINTNATSLVGAYYINTNIDASATATWNSGAGFIPLGTDSAGHVWNGSAFVSGGTVGFSGYLFGGTALHSINNLTINRPSANYVGLIGYLSGNGTTTGVVNGVGVVNTTVSGGGNYTGGLVAYQASGTVFASYASGSVHGDGFAGGLVSFQAAGSINYSNSSATVTSTAAGAGGLLGGQYGSVDHSYATGAVSSLRYSGGLVGASTSGTTITNSYATGAVSGGSYVGGLVGFAQGGSITQAYATGAVSGTGSAPRYIGGLVGQANGSISQVYETGAVTSAAGSQYVGGLIGYVSASATLSQSWNSGFISVGASSTNVGGIVGYWAAASTAVTGDFYDSYSTGQSLGFGGTSSGFSYTTVTSNPASPNAYTTSNYTTGPAGFTLTAANWIFFNGQTRPFLSFEPSALIVNSHQLQLVGANSTTLSYNGYSVLGPIDLSATGAPTVGVPSSYSGLWAPTGWVPIGTDGVGTVLNAGHGFSGTITGNLQAISGLTIKRPTTQLNGLFGESIGTINTLYLSGGNITGSDDTGGLIGFQNGGSLNFSLSNANVSGGASGNYIGGLVGFDNGAAITSSGSTGAVFGLSRVGGVVGEADDAAIANSFATGAVSGTSSSSTLIGGLAGTIVTISTGTSTITNSFATGPVSGGSYVGGLVGQQIDYESGPSTISQSYASGAVSGSVSGSSIGGLVGVQRSSGTGDTVKISQSYATGAVSGHSNVGGLVGYQYVASGSGTASIFQTYATGSVSGVGANPINIGGLVGAQIANGTGSSLIDQSYASGAATGVGNVGGLVGLQANGTSVSNEKVTNSYWDSYSTGLSYGVSAFYPGTIFSATAVTSNPAGTTAYTAATYSNFSAVSGIGTATTTGWVFLPGSVRPMLAFEVPTAAIAGTNAAGQINVSNAHQLALINYSPATLSAAYDLTGTISLSQDDASALVGGNTTYPGVFGATGFVPLGTNGAGGILNSGHGFSGTVNGAGNQITGLIINRPTTNYVGLFGYSSGTISNLTSSETVTGFSYVGGLVGYQSGGTLSNDMVSGSVTSTGTGSNDSYFTGGMVGELAGGAISGGGSSATVSGDQDVGGVVGYQQGTGSSLTGVGGVGAVSGTSSVGGLVGYSEGNISASSSGAGATVAGVQFVGGLVGGTASGTISGSSSTAPVSGQFYLGGLVGYQYAAASISGGSAAGNVTGSGTASFIGGLVGSSNGSISGVTDSLTQTVSGKNYIGGIAGYQGAGAISTTSTIATVTSTGNFVGGLVGGEAGGTLSSDTASGAVSGVSYVGGLVGYQTAGAITGGVTHGNVTGTSYFVGGLVGAQAAGTITTSSSSGGTVSGPNDTGGLVGFQDSGSGGITNSSSSDTVIGGAGSSNIGELIGYSFGLVSGETASGIVSGTSFVGGLIGRAYANTVSSSTASGAVTGTTDVGGLVGYLDPAATLSGDSTLTSFVTVTGTTNVGGLVGLSGGTITGGRSSELVSGASNVGGLVGYQSGGSIATSSAIGSATGTTAVGGLIGLAAGGGVDQSYSTSAVTGTGGANYVGGLIGQQAAGTVTNSYSAGVVTGGASSSFVGGLIGYQSNATFSIGYSVSPVTGTSFVGSLLGYQDIGSNFANVVWNTTVSVVQRPTVFARGYFKAFVYTTAQLQSDVPATYNAIYGGWNFTTIWNTPNGTAYPTLRNTP